MKPLAEPQSESRFTEMDGCSRMEHERLKSNPAKGLGFHLILHERGRIEDARAVL